MKKTIERTSNKQEDLKVVRNEQANDGVEEQKAPLMLSIEETAIKSGLSAYTIRTWVKTKKLPYILIGRKYLISWDNFCHFLNSNMG